MTSLLSTCRNILTQLDTVPAFQSTFPAQNRTDPHPVSSLWFLYRLGNPLVVLFNAAVDGLYPPLMSCEDATADNLRACKKATVVFLRGMVGLGEVVQDLVPGAEKWSAEDLFTVSEPLQHSTDGLVKVNTAVLRLLTVMQLRGLIPVPTPSPTSSNMVNNHTGEHKSIIEPNNSDYIVNDNVNHISGTDAKKPLKKHFITNELLTTEQAYVAHLNTLSTARTTLLSRNIITHDSAFNLFSNLPLLTDVQRKFSVALEGADDCLEWPGIFLAHEKELEVYIPYVANLTRAQKEVGVLKSVLDASGVMTQSEMDQFISRPFQRLVKYDQLLAAWLKETPENNQLRLAHEMSVRLLHKVDSGVAARMIEIENSQKSSQLLLRINNFKDPDEMRSFGKLLRSDILKIKLHSSESEYLVYIFEALFLCCKPVDISHKDYNRYSTPASIGSSSPSSASTKRKNSLKKAQSRDSSNPVELRGKDNEPLRIKGRVFFRNVTGVYKFGVEGNQLAVWWRNKSDQEMLILHCNSEAQLNEWTDLMNERVSHYVSKRRMTYESQGHSSVTPLSATGSFASQGMLSGQSPGRLTRRSTSPWVMSMVDEPEQLPPESITSERFSQDNSNRRIPTTLAPSPRIYSSSRLPPSSASMSILSSSNGQIPTTPPQLRKPSMPPRSMTTGGIEFSNHHIESPNGSPKLQSSILASPLSNLRPQQSRTNLRRPSRDDSYGSPSSFSLSQHSSPQMQDLSLNEPRQPSHSFNPNYSMADPLASALITGSPLKQISMGRTKSEANLTSLKRGVGPLNTNSPSSYSYKVPDGCDFACKIRFDDHIIVTGLRKTDQWASLYRTVWKSICKATQRADLGSLKVRWLDPDGDLVALSDDEDVMMVIEWAESTLAAQTCVELLINAEIA